MINFQLLIFRKVVKTHNFAQDLPYWTISRIIESPIGLDVSQFGAMHGGKLLSIPLIMHSKLSVMGYWLNCSHKLFD